MKPINEVIELMRDGDYGIGVTNEEELEEILSVLKDNGFRETECLKSILVEAIDNITTGVRQGCVVELYTDCIDRIVYVYTNKKDFDSDGERVAGEGILFSSIEFPDTKPIDLLRNFDIIGFKNTTTKTIYYNGVFYTPWMSVTKFNEYLVEEDNDFPLVVNKIARKDKTVWEREINVEDLELGTEVEVEVKDMKDTIHGTIISSNSERMILFDNYTTSKSLIKGTYKIVKICE